MPYKNPPKQMRFRPGVSGNPLGRPANISDADIAHLLHALQVILQKAGTQLRTEIKQRGKK